MKFASSPVTPSGTSNTLSTTPLAPPPKDSIMGLFGDEPEHRTLSGKDMALLRGIYSMPPDREAYQHRNRLVGAVRKGED